VSGAFVVSLDFELHWGVRDSIARERYLQNLLGVRRAVPAILETFRRHDIHATWATVGILFFETRQELLANLPERRPRYADRALDPYPHLAAELGTNEADDPIHFAPSLIKQIAATPGQEIGSHTFSHYYCLEDGRDEEAFRDDLRAASRAAARHGLTLQSLVFPRNQFRRDYLATCRELGIRAYRGNPPSWMYREDPGRAWLRRGARLLDAYLPLTGDNSWAPRPDGDGPLDARASRFLRPVSPLLRPFEPLRARRILRDLDRAAARDRIYHLWWHPHNFGAHLEENLAFLERILRRVDELRSRHGLRSLNMGELAADLAMSQAA
jgi:peptidoglycan/xylan/chitin deacetylase (PgdA/CDA1 family)